MRDKQDISIKPCPFCGCNVVGRELGYDGESTVIVCFMCGAVGPAHGDDDKAVTLWNTRSYVQYSLGPAAFKPLDGENKVML